MDPRIEQLLTDFPVIFDRRRPRLGDLEEDWIIIDVVGDPDKPDKLEADDPFLSDLDRFDSDPSAAPRETLTDPWAGPGEWADMPLPPGVDISRANLIEILRRPKPKEIDELRRRIRGGFAGAPAGLTPHSLVPPPDALACYLPFHVYPNMWGIYLIDVGVNSLATDLQGIVRLLGRSISPMDARRVARAYLFHHEAYHCAVESFALRCELATRRPVYRTGSTKLYQRGHVPGEPHEETLASAYGLRKVRRNVRLPRQDLDAAVTALKIYLCLCPPGYREGINYLDDGGFDELERRFLEEVMRASSRGALPPSAWTMGTFMMSPLLQRNRKYSWICNRRDFRQRSKLAVHYFRRRDVISCLEKLAGAHIEPGGKHLHLVRSVKDTGQTKPRRTQVPSGEVPRGTLSGMLRDLGLDLNIEGFREECRKARRPV